MPNCKHIVGAAAINLRVKVWQRGKIGVKSYALMNTEKRPIFDIFRRQDTENFCHGCQHGHGRLKIWNSEPPDFCSVVVSARHCRDMHGLPLLQTRLPGFAKEGEITLQIFLLGTYKLQLVTINQLNI